ncbi:hypothetical protein [Streptomyces sp. NPDC102437]|uniref:hypothetical protein n=1 Tax=Streptomyces sp. NPDC102437 TaxID=3366175 RepID=UPI00382D081E
MPDNAQELGALLAQASAPAQGGGTVSAQVVDVTDTGVNVMIGGSLILDVPCADSYRGRAAGDWVAVRSGARPVVMWRLGADPGGADEAVVHDIATDVALDTQVVRAATWGTPAPTGPGWQTVQALYMRQVNGKVELYGQLGTVTDPSPGPPPARPPKPVTLSAQASGAWRSGRPDETRNMPYQGDYTGRGNLRGGWFYGSNIAAACAGKSAASMKVQFTRARGAGSNSKRPLHLYLHAHTSPPGGQLNLIGSGNDDLLSLSAGATGTATLPASWRTQLASGSARGLAIYASGSTDYMGVSGGRLTITFS